MIAIVAPRNDLHARWVSKHLLRMNRSCIILDTAELIQLSTRQIISSDLRRCHRFIGNSQPSLVDVDKLGAIWFRRPRLPTLDDILPFSQDKEFARAEWNAAIDGLIRSCNARFVNDPLLQSNASKPRQLSIAARCGLRIPDTLISNQPEHVAEFVAKHRGRVVHKALTSMPDRFFATKRWAPLDAAQFRSLPVAPTIFQEEIDGVLDLRITVMGERIFAVQFATTNFVQHDAAWIDNRLDLDVKYVPHSLPQPEAKALAQVMRELGLVFGTVDMKINKSGEYIFLEINPQGQFLYVEILAELPLGEKMAEFLAM